MSIFASKTAASLGCTCYRTDPSTWFTHYGAVEPGSQIEPNYECFKHFPHSQHNEPNPILVAFRAMGGDAAVWHQAVFAMEIYGGHREWDDPRAYFHSLTKATDDQVDHAERVLNRLVLAAEVSL